MIEIHSFSFPLVAEFAGYFVYKGTKLKEFLFGGETIEEIEVRVVVDLPLFRP